MAHTETTTTDADGSAPTEVRRGHRRLVLVAGAIFVVFALAAAWFTFGGQRAEESSEDLARERLGPATSAPASAPTTAPTAALVVPPAAGLYRYQGSGHENTSFPPLTEDQGPNMPGTVTAGSDGCWVLQIDYNTHHWQDWHYCTAGGELRESRGATFSRRNLGGANIDNTSEFVCDPPVVVLLASDQPGTTRTRSCTGTGTLVPAETVAAGTMTVVGREDVAVGGRGVPTVHVRYDLTYAGGQSGTETTELWFAAATGLPVRNEHQITVNTETPFGRITYTEDAQFTLQTATPV